MIHAGRGRRRMFSLERACQLMAQEQPARELANSVLRYALELEEGKPRDDMVVAVMKVVGRGSKLGIRRVSASYPL